MSTIKQAFLAIYMMFLVCPLSAIDIEFKSIDFDAQLRVAAFFPVSHRYQEIYGDAGPSVQLEVGARFDRPYELWGNLDWVYGEKSGSITRTTVNVINFSFGMKYVYSLTEKCQLSLGFGPTFGGIFLKNKSIFYRSHPSRFVAGGVIKSDIKYAFCNGLFVDAFLDYMCEPVCFNRVIDIGGFRLGLGMGYRF